MHKTGHTKATQQCKRFKTHSKLVPASVANRVLQKQPIALWPCYLPGIFFVVFAHQL